MSTAADRRGLMRRYLDEKDGVAAKALVADLAAGIDTEGWETEEMKPKEILSSVLDFFHKEPDPDYMRRPWRKVNCPGCDSADVVTGGREMSGGADMECKACGNKWRDPSF